MVLEASLIKELKDAFDEHAENGTLNQERLAAVFTSAGESVPNFKIREFLEKRHKEKDPEIGFEEFCELFDELNLNKSWGSKLRNKIQTRTGLTAYAGSKESSEGTLHSISDSERHSFSNLINKVLRDDPDLKTLLPIDVTNDDMFTKVGDGRLLCKLINWAVPNTIDERAINKTKLNTFTINENLNLAINSCSAIGCHVVNVSAEDIVEKRHHLILGLQWQIIRIGYLSRVSPKSNPNLVCLLEEGETLETLLAMSPEEILIRWVNYHIGKTSCTKKMTNFSSDLKDSEIYAHLMDCILKDKITHSSPTILRSQDLKDRAQMVVLNAENATCAGLVQPEDIVSGSAKLGLAFIAELFNTFPELEQAEENLVIEETREEKTYRNWMNSLGVKPTVYYLYNDLSNGMVLLKLEEVIQPDCVNWDKVNKPPFTGPSATIKKIENCNKAVEIGKNNLKLSLVGTAGDDIVGGSKTLILGLVWQLMSRYTLSILQKLSKSQKPISETEIVEWVNCKLSQANMKISGFKDRSISTSLPILEVIEAIQPNTVKREYIQSGNTEEDKLKNAMYAVSLARKIGATVYALPEDITEEKSKMIMTIFACLMACDLKGR